MRGAVIVDGNNADDRGDYRPGRQAAREFGVRSPLDEVDLTKDEIRDLSQIDSVKFSAAALLECGLIAAAVWISTTWWNPVIYVLAVIVIGLLPWLLSARVER